MNSTNIQKIFYLQTDMDPLHTLKKFGIFNGHIEGNIEPASEKCHFPEDRKLKQHASLFQYSRVASKVMMLHFRRS